MGALIKHDIYPQHMLSLIPKVACLVYLLNVLSNALSIDRSEMIKESVGVKESYVYSFYYCNGFKITFDNLCKY